MKVIIKKDIIESYGRKILDNAEDFNTDLNKIQSILDSVENAWQGDDSIKYIRIMREKYVMGLKELGEFITEYGKYLQKVPGAYETLDEVFASKNINV